MFFKFLGGDETTLKDVFDSAVVRGNLRFTCAAEFNDPFEFMFKSVPPSREAFDRWHATYAPEQSPSELANAWDAFHRPGARLNTQIIPQRQLLEMTFVLCLAKNWNSHLMWAHYASAHRGFVIRYRPHELVATLRGFCDGGAFVSYSTDVPELRWFTCSPEDQLHKTFFTKSNEWAYEGEYRVLLQKQPGPKYIDIDLDTSLIDGVILGARASSALIAKARDLKAKRPGVSIEQITLDRETYQIRSRTLL